VAASTQVNDLVALRERVAALSEIDTAIAGCCNTKFRQVPTIYGPCYDWTVAFKQLEMAGCSGKGARGIAACCDVRQALGFRGGRSCAQSAAPSSRGRPDDTIKQLRLYFSVGAARGKSGERPTKQVRSSGVG
jgi:hypothetical protein